MHKLSCQFRTLSLITGALLASCNVQSVTADTIIYNAKVYTVNLEKPWVQAIAIKDSKIVSLGSDTDILQLKGPDTQIMDAGGNFVMPGFIEGHGHFPGLGSSLRILNLLHSRSWEEIVEAVAVKVKTAKPGEWIIGRGWHQEKWLQTPGQNVLGYPYHHALSAVSPSNPVLLEHASGHALLANRAAMDAAGVTLETADPKGGHIVRGDGDEAIGVFEENAQDIIEEAHRQYLTSLSEEEIHADWYEGIRLAQDECLRKGITSFQDAGSSLEEVTRLEDLALAGELDIRLWMMIRHTSDYLLDKLSEFPKVGLGQDFFTCRALKISIDGALGTYGAWLLEPYTDNPGFIGQNTSSLDELAKLADLCAEHQLQLCTHAIGDRANREVLNVYEQKMVQHKLSQDVRWRIEHAQHLSPEDIPRFGRLHVIASMQGIHCTSDAPFVIKRLGEKRAKSGAYVWRSLLDSGAVVANGTDTPVEDIDPIKSLYATVTRKRVDSAMEFYPEQKLTRAEAIYSYTMANAYAAFEENIKGSLEPDKYADIIVLSKDIMSCTDEEIPDAKVLLTIVNGEIKYRQSGF